MERAQRKFEEETPWLLFSSLTETSKNRLATMEAEWRIRAEKAHEAATGWKPGDPMAMPRLFKEQDYEVIKTLFRAARDLRKWTLSSAPPFGEPQHGPSGVDLAASCAKALDEADKHFNLKMGEIE